MFINYLDLDQTFFLFYLKHRITQKLLYITQKKNFIWFHDYALFIYLFRNTSK